MATITFKGKLITVYNMDETIAYYAIKIPELKKSHCDMNAFRKHKTYGGIANSDLFPNALKRIRRDVFGIKDCLRIDQLPPNVTVDMDGFLKTVTIFV